MNTAIDIAIGRYGGVVPIGKFGKNNNVGADYEDISDQGGSSYPYLDIAQAIEVLSDNAEDGTSGIGAHTIRVFGLDNDYRFQDELVELNGLTPSALSLPMLRIWRAQIETAGSAGRALGNITIRTVVSGTTQAKIVAQEEANQTLMALFSIPAKKYGLLFNVYASCRQQEVGAEIAIQTRNKDEVFQTKHEMPIYQECRNHVFSFPKTFKPMTDIRVRGRRIEGNVSIVAGFGLLLVDEENVSSVFSRLE